MKKVVLKVIKVETKIIKNEEDIDTIGVSLEEDNTTLGEYLMVANAMVQRIKNQFDINDEEIIKVILQMK